MQILLMFLIAILTPFIVWALFKFAIRTAWSLVKLVVSIITAPIGWLLGGFHR